jgi:putative ABC transport system permease protein
MPQAFREAAFLGKRMLLHKPGRFFATVIGVGIAFFLATAQFGLLVGWINTNTALIRHSGADLWVMAVQAPAFDYGTAIPRQRLYQARSIEGVEWTQPVFMAWNIWQRGDGRRVNIELVGVDRMYAAGPWMMSSGSLESIRRPNTVVVDELYLKTLGIGRLGESFEMIGERATIGGICRGIRTFTASPFVFTSVEQAIRYDKRYRDDEITYAVAGCRRGVAVGVVQSRMQRAMANVEVLTTHQFCVRSAKYWMLETGVGITVVITAFLGLAVATVITSQTLFAITHDHLPNYAALLALGFSRNTLLSIVLVQSVVLGACGIALGTLLFGCAAWASVRTPIPLETTPLVFALLVIGSFATSLLASLMSARAVFRVDPITVFR